MPMSSASSEPGSLSTLTPSLTSTSNITFTTSTTYTSSGVFNSTLPTGSYTSAVSSSPSNITTSIPVSPTSITSNNITSPSASPASQVVTFANTTALPFIGLSTSLATAWPSSVWTSSVQEFTSTGLRVNIASTSMTSSALTSPLSSKVVKAVVTVTPSAGTASRAKTLTELTTEFTTSTLRDDKGTSTIPTNTRTITIITPVSTGRIEPYTIMRNKSAVVGIAVGGVVVVVCGILVFTFVMWKRRRRVLWRSDSPDTPYTERAGRVLIRGHSPDGASHQLAGQEWKPSLVSEIGGEDTKNGGREDEDEELYSGQYYQDPVTLPVERDEYGSIMATVYDYGTVDYSDESTSPTVFPRLEVVQEEEEEEENEISSTVRHQSKAGEADHEWEQVNAATSDPFADPEPELKHRQSSASLPPVAISPLSYPKLSNPALIKPKEPNGLREGGNYNAGLSPSSADIAVGSKLIFDPYTLHTHYPDRNPPPHPSPYLLLHPPLRPKLTGSLTDFVSSSSLPSGTLNLPAITVTPLASPGESIDSYHPDGLLDPALLEARSLQSEGGPRGEVSSESLVDYVDYSRRISSVC
ncbi:hypothetical protein F5051DRAFT_422447 [Lentinula edodes]|nr:hypothetical protein F5051DRAFT_422447 [Lentinula edodes]